MAKDVNSQLICGMTLDSWAILAWLQGEEPGMLVKNLIAWSNGEGERVEEIGPLLGENINPPQLYLNVINLGEIFYILGRRRGEDAALDVVNRLQLTTLEIVPATTGLVLQAARIKTRYPIAYADAFAVATAEVTGSILLTGDPELKDLNEVKIFWLGAGGC
jgi:predicted nucleic acid-binding protein